MSLKYQSILHSTWFVTVILLMITLSACGGAKSNSGNRSVSTETNIIASASYGNTTCAIKAQRSDEVGTLSCWGQIPSMVITSVATGEASKSFRIEALPAAMSTDANWFDVAIGDSHICGIKKLPSGNRLFCMGWNNHGQMGLPRYYYLDDDLNPEINSRNFYPTMSLVGSSGDWIKLSAASEHTCGIFGNDDLKCWGFNSYGVLAQNTIDNIYDDLDTQNQTNTIRRVLTSDSIPDIANWLTVSTNDSHTCGIKKDEAILKDAYSLWCWGSNNRLQLGLAATSTAATSQFVTKVTLPDVGFNQQTDVWLTVSSGNEHTCAISATKVDATIPLSGKLWCWGNNIYNETGSATASKIILQNSNSVDSSSNWVSVAAGLNKSCAVNDAGSAFCFGYNASVPFVDNSFSMTAVSGLNENWRSIEVGYGHECGVKTITESNVTKSQLHCWGQQQFAQLGTGFDYNNYIPNIISNNDASVDSPYVWKTLAAGGIHSCAIKNDNSLWCWGRNYWGQLGLGNDIPKISLTQVGLDVDWSTVDSYFKATCARKENNSLWCWGQNGDGQLGNGTTNDEGAPLQTDDAGLDWATVANGQYHTCGLKSTLNNTENSLWCWGSTFYGQLGPAIAVPLANAVTTYSTTKVQVPGVWKAGKLFSGKYNTCAIKITSDVANPTVTIENLMCWGRNKYQEIKTVATVEINEPTLIPRPELGSGLKWITASIGKRYICAIASKDTTATEGSLWCWGDNYLGAVGNPDHYSKIDNTSTATYNASRFIPVSTPFNVNTSDTPGFASGTKTLWRQVSAHDENVCAIRSDDTLWCWGDNEFGENGNGNNVLSSAPVKEATQSDNWVAVSLGDNHACGLQTTPGKTNYSLWCWGGRSFERQIGDSRLVNLQPALIQ